MQPASICLVAELPPPAGGMAVQAQLLTRLLRAAGHRVINVPTNPLAVDSRWRRWPLLRGLINFILFLGELPRACSKADIVHVFSHSYLSFFLFSLPPILCAKLLRKPVILHYHGGAADSFLKRWGIVARPFIKMAQRVIVPSGFLREAFARHGVGAFEIPNVLAAEFTFRMRQPLRPRFIMARHLEPAYNVGCGLRAFRLVLDRHPEASLLVAGGGRERTALEQLARELGISGHVTFTGAISNEGIRQLYDECDVYLNSSNVDNQPVSILEAFSSGLPVVTTAAGGIPYMVNDGVDALLANVGDAPALAQRALRLFEEPDLAQRLIENGRLRTEAFQWPAVYRQLQTVYAQVLTR